MSDEQPASQDKSLVINQLIAEYMGRTDSGEALSPDDFIAAHPNHAEELRQHFENIELLDGLQQTDGQQDVETQPDAGNGGKAKQVDPDQTITRGGTDSETSVTRDFERRDTEKTEVAIPEQFGRYAIKKVLGQGAMGAVYLARDTQLDRDVALKIPKFGDGNNVDDEELLERFYREARASATLRSLNICPVYDVGEIDGQHYITMAFIEGRPLKDFTKSKKKHSEKQIATTIRKLALGLAEAHSIGVIHRDLKPANIMVDLKGEPVVMDFGLARRSSSDDVQVTQSGAILGTPAYMAPEQVAGDQAAINHQVDIYALGVIMYELITGEMPFKGNLMAILQQIALNNPTKPSELRDNLDSRLEKICLKMMAGDQKQRYQSMNDVAADLQDVIKHPNRKQKKEAAKKTGPKPKAIPTAYEESNPALISVEQPKSYAEQLRKKKSKPSSKSARSSTRLPQTASSSADSHNKKKYLLFGGLGGLILLLGIIFLIRVGNYDVQITLDDPGITLSVDGEVLNIKDGQDVIKLKAGEHKLQLQKDGLKTHVEEFTVTKDGKTALTATVVNGQLDGLLNGEKPRENTGPINNTLQQDNSLAFEGKDFALEFDGAGNYVVIPSLHFDGTAPITIEATVRIPEVAEELAQIVKLNSIQLFCNPHTFSYSVWGRSLTSGINKDESFTAHANSKLEADQIYRLAGVYDGESVKLFVNGVLQKEVTTAPPRAADPYANVVTFLGSASPNPNRPEGKNFFSGVMDEVRISNSARYTSNYLPSKKLQKDNQTIALYHFDEGQGDVLKDSSGNGHHGKIIGAKWVKVDWQAQSRTVKPATDNYALQFGNGETRVEILSLPPALRNQFTVEFWARPATHPTNQGINWSPVIFGNKQPFLDLGFNRGQMKWSWGANQPAIGKWTVMSDASRYSESPEMAHIVGQYDKGRLEFFVNGISVNNSAVSNDTDSNKLILDAFANARTSPLILGSTPQSSGHLDGGVIDSLRISIGLRYKSEFYPETNLSSDSSTIAFYDFNEGQGDVLHDSSGNGHHGKIVGAKWVRIDDGKKRGALHAGEPTASGNYALRFDGSNSEPFVAKLDNEEPIEEYTVEAWGTSEGPEVTKHFVEVLGPETGAVIRLSQNDVSGWMAYRFHAVVEESPNARVKFSTERTHVANVYSSGKISLFVNGELKGSSPVTKPPMQFDTLRLGPQFKDVNFEGIVDEVRFSRVARYTENFQPAERFEPDDKTVALYHFDEGNGNIAKDSSGNGYHAKIIGAKWVHERGAPQPAQSVESGFQLEFLENREHSVEVPTLKLNGEGPLTIEAYVNWGGVIISTTAFVGVDDGLRIQREGRSRIRARWTTPETDDNWNDNKTDFEALLHKGELVHLAAVYTGDKVLTFRNGRLHHTTPVTDSILKESKKFFKMGGRKGTRLGPVRVSSTARYLSEFTPSKDLNPDEHTIALYNFDEGSGDVLKDSSGNGHDGTIIGAKWVRVGGPDFGFADLPETDLLRAPGVNSADPYCEKQSDGSWSLFKGTLHFPQLNSGDYRLDLGFQQDGGVGGELKVLLPIGKSQVELVIPDERFSKNGQNTELHLVDGTSEVIDGARLQKSRDQWLTIQVRQVGDQWHFAASLDDQELLNRLFDEQQLSAPESARASQAREIKISATSINIQLETVKLRGDVDAGEASKQTHTQPVRSPTTESERTSTETSLYFSHPDDEVIIPTLKDDTEALTIEVWLQRDSTHLAPHSQIVGYSPYASIFSNSHTALDFQMPDTGGDDGPTKGYDEVGVGQPVHIAGVRDPANEELRLYYDGKLVKTSKGQINRGNGTFQIASNEFQWKGGGGDNSFSGWIDEIRISKSVRYQSDFTPQRQFEKDDKTTALYHFEEGTGDVLKDSSSNGHHGKIVGAKWVHLDDQQLSQSEAVTRQSYALKFPGTQDDRDVSAMIPYVSGPITLECWAQPTTLPDENNDMLGLIRAWDLFHLQFQQAPGESKPRWFFVTTQKHDKKWASLMSPTLDALPNKPVHLAGVYDEHGEMRLYINGILQEIPVEHWPARTPIIGNQFSLAPPRLGDPFQVGLYGFKGIIDEIRLSNTTRYVESFTPLQSFESDEHTIALYHLDKGTEEVLRDSSGNGHHGKIIGAKWNKLQPRLFGHSESSNQNRLSEILSSTDFEWSEPENLGAVINSSTEDRAPSISSDGFTLVFNSRRQGPDGIEQLARAWVSKRESVESEWSKPVPLPTERFEVANSPELSANGLSLTYFRHSLNNQNNKSEIFEAQRAGRDLPFAAGQPLVNINSSENENEMTLTSDGLMILFVSDRDGQRKLYESKRTALSEPFSSPVLVHFSEKTDLLPNDIAITADGLTLFVVHGKHWQVSVASRTTLDDAFGPIQDISLRGVHKLDVSADGRTIWFSKFSNTGEGEDDIWMSRLVPKAAVSKSEPSESSFVEYLSLRHPEDRVAVPLDSIPELNPVTIEAWGRPKVAPPEGDDDQFIMSLRGNHQVKLETTDLGGVIAPRWEYKLKLDPNSASINPPRAVPLNEWSHLACVREGAAMRMYVNGRLVGSNNRDGILENDTGEFTIGFLSDVNQGFIGDLKEIRVSSIARYTDDFQPDERHTSDEKTELLFHCDEIRDGKLIDSSGHERHGILTVSGLPIEEPGSEIPGLVGYWNFETIDGVTIRDHSLFRNNGTLTGEDLAEAQSKDVPETSIANRHSFNVEGKRNLRVEASPSLKTSQELTVSLWCKYMNANQENANLIDHGSGNSYRLTTVPGPGLRLLMPHQKLTIRKSIEKVGLKQWIHIAAVRDESHVALYVNGELADSEPIAGTLSDAEHSLVIGGGEPPFQGLLDEVRVYNRALSISELRLLCQRN